MNQAAFETLKETRGIGDKVKVVLQVDKGVHGNLFRWDSGMTEQIGKVLTIKEFDSSDNTILLSDSRYYPALALMSDNGPIIVELPDYKAEIHADRVQVGCQCLTKQMVLDIVKGAVSVGFMSESDLEGLR